MQESKKNTSKNSVVSDVDQHILQQLRRAEIKRVALKGKGHKNPQSLSEEFFEGVKIV